MIIDCISDLHGHYPDLEGGDLLIVAGDLTARDRPEEYFEFSFWLSKQDYKRMIIIGGNHDNGIASRHSMWKNMLPLKAHYLCDSGTEFEGLKIWGSPWTKTFPDMNPLCKAFTADTEEELSEKFEKIPHDVDILITHSPPHTILDSVRNDMTGKTELVGSKYLYGWFTYCARPKLHVFGHIHEGYGIKKQFTAGDDRMVTFINASHVNERYEPVNKPIRVIL